MRASVPFESAASALHGEDAADDASCMLLLPTIPLLQCFSASAAAQRSAGPGINSQGVPNKFGYRGTFVSVSLC